MELSEKAAKKLGEIFAFAEVGNETLRLGTRALEEFMGAPRLKSIIEINQDHQGKINGFAREFKVEKIVTEKAVKTVEKLQKMRDIYLQDRWDDPIEIFEWLSFFEGAAMAHWGLIRGVSESINRLVLIDFAKSGEKFHHLNFHLICEKLHAAGMDASR